MRGSYQSLTTVIIPCSCQVNFTITYWLSLASGLFRVQAPFILKHADEVKAIVRLILPIKCSIGINVSGGYDVKSPRIDPS